jgi:hypothetical protein
MQLLDFPILVFAISLAVLWLATWVGGSIFGRRRALDEHSRADYNGVAGAILTLLGLIIGFSFSMAVSRYDQRKTFEEAEANAIGTEYVRADILPAADAARVQALLKRYLDLRIEDYTTRNEADLRRLNAETSRLQSELWSAARTGAAVQATPLAALAASGMNDVINSQGYTQAAWWNRIPATAWALMAVIATVGCALVGYGAVTFRAEAYFIWVLPMVLSISFFLIADIDSPRGGLINVKPQNLIALAQSIREGGNS